MSPGTEGRSALDGMVRGAQRKSREWQRDQLRRTGFATTQPELGHSAVMTLREMGFSPTVAQIGGQLAAVPTAYNWQGNTRVAQVVGKSKRTVQRARATLEAAGLITSELLLTGDMLEGQRAPVWHPQVVRDVSQLQRLTRLRETERAAGNPVRRRKRRKGPSAAEYSPIVPQPVVSADDFRKLGEAHPEFAVFYSTMAEAAAKRERTYQPPTPPPNAPATIDPRQIDLWEEETARRERGPPPERGPPKR